MRYVLAIIALIFGAAAAQAQEGYRVQRGDLLGIEVLEDSSLNRQLLVLPDGRVNVPLAGSIVASGRTLTQIQDAISNALAPNFATQPTVYVSINRLTAPDQQQVRMISVYVMGEISSPGARQVEAGTRLLQFLAEAGQFGPFAATKRLQLRRRDANGAENIYTINYRALERGATLRQNFTMQDGDVLIVPQRRLFE